MLSKYKKDKNSEINEQRLLKRTQSFDRISRKNFIHQTHESFYLLKLKAQSNSISDLDKKHKAWGRKNLKKINLLDK